MKTDPPLTTVATPREDLARSVLDMLYRYGEGEQDVREPVLPAQIVLRESTAGPRTR